MCSNDLKIIHRLFQCDNGERRDVVCDSLLLSSYRRINGYKEAKVMAFVYSELQLPSSDDCREH